MRPRASQRDAGVSPVVGTILVLGITIAGIAGVMVWGLPAITEMQATVEHQSVENEFIDLQTDAQQLSQADIGQTAYLWRMSESHGSFAVLPLTEPWVLSADETTGLSLGYVYNFTEWNMNSTTNEIVLENYATNGRSQNFVSIYGDVRATLFSGSSQIPLTVTFTQAGAVPVAPSSGLPTKNDCPQGGPPANAYTAGFNWPAATGPKTATAYAFCLYNGNTPVSLGASLVQIQIWYFDPVKTTNREVAGYFWAADAGRAQWRYPGPLSYREVYFSNGVTIGGINGNLLLQGTPPISPPIIQSGQWRFFERFTTINGNASLGGQGSTNVLLTLYGAPLLANQLPSTDAKIWVSGYLAPTWTSYFLNSGYGMKQVAEYNALAPANTKYLEFDTSNPTNYISGSPGGLQMIVQQDVISAGVGSS